MGQETNATARRVSVALLAILVAAALVTALVSYNPLGGGSDSQRGGRDAAAGDAALDTAATVRPAHTRKRGFPGKRTTGVPAGKRLRPSGSLTVTRDGAVIKNLDVIGSIRIEADDVTIKRVRVRRPGGQAITVSPDTRGAVIKDVELDGRGNTDGSSAIGDSNYKLVRVHIHHFGEGPRANGNVVIRDSYMHSFLDFIDQGAHQDVIQSTGGNRLVVRHNKLIMNVDGGNAVLMLGTDYGSNVLFEHNLVAGGGYAMYGGGLQRLDERPVPGQPVQQTVLRQVRVPRAVPVRRERREVRATCGTRAAVASDAHDQDRPRDSRLQVAWQQGRSRRWGCRFGPADARAHHAASMVRRDPRRSRSGLLAAGATYASIEPTYQASGSVLLLNPQSQVDPASGKANPYVGNLTVAAKVVTVVLDSRESRLEFLRQGHRGVYTLGADPSSPIVVVTTIGETLRSRRARPPAR